MQKEVFTLCKNIKESQARSDLLIFTKKLYDSWSGHEGDFLNKVFYEFFKNSAYQFLSFILEYKKIELNQQLKARVTNFITSHELDLILNLHKFLAYINDRCMRPILNINNNYFKPIHPYSHFDYRHECTSSEIFDNLVKDNNDLIERIVSKYENHKTIKNLESLCSGNSLKDYPSEFWIHEVDNFKALIRRYGIFEFPKELTTGHSEIPQVIRETVFNLISLRSSLFVLNQLIFQSFLYDKLKIINTDNAFQISRSTGMYISESIEVFCNWANFDGFSVKPREILKVNLKTNHTHYDGIYILENHSSSFGGNEGEILQLGLRKIKEELNYLF